MKIGEIVASDWSIGSCNNGETALLKLCSNGEIYVKGNLCTNDMEVYEAAREFFLGQAINNFVAQQNHINGLLNDRFALKELIDKILAEINDTPLYAHDFSLTCKIQDLIKEYKGIK